MDAKRSLSWCERLKTLSSQHDCVGWNNFHAAQARGPASPTTSPSGATAAVGTPWWRSAKGPRLRAPAILGPMDTITLGELASLLDQHRLDAALEGDPSVAVAGAACDSRQVTPGNIFVCKGAAFRPEFLSAALEAGAAAYLCTPDAAPGTLDSAGGR